MIRSNRSQKGFSLLELLLVLGVIAALAIAAFIVYPSVQAGNQAQAAAADLNTVQAGLKGLFTNGRYLDLTNTVANEARVIPSTLNAGETTGGDLINGWGGTVTLAPFLNGGTVPTHFSIVYEDVPQAACVKLIPAIASNFEGVITDSGVVSDQSDLDGVGVAGTDQFAPATVGAACANDLNTITVYGR